jgi:hypothetical protein
MQSPDFDSMEGDGCRPAPAVSRLPAHAPSRSPIAFPQNLPFELDEDCQQARHRATGWNIQTRCVGQRNEAKKAMLQFLDRGQEIYSDLP